MSCGTEDGCRRGGGGFGILRRANTGSASGQLLAGSCPGAPPVARRVRFSDAGPGAAASTAAAAAPPQTAAAAVVAAAAARPASAPGWASPLALLGAAPAAATAFASPSGAAVAAAAAAAPPPAGLPATRSYRSGRFAVHEGVLLLATHASEQPAAASPPPPPSSTAPQTAPLIDIGRCVSLPETTSLGLQATAEGAGAAQRFAASLRAAAAAGAPRSCPDLPMLAEERGGGAGGGDYGSSSSNCSSCEEGAAAAAPATAAKGGGGGGGGGGEAHHNQQQQQQHHHGPRRPAVAYFRRGRFMVCATSVGSSSAAR